MELKSRKQLAIEHGVMHTAIFKLKTIILSAQRVIKNIFNPVKKFKTSTLLAHAPVISSSESPLWNPDDNDENWILTAGKIENLRIAVKELHGIVIPANEIFSFWKHIGYPNFGKGYVMGREVREGCLIPTIAGGLCQLSNALFDAAKKANFEIIERHRHTAVVKGSLAEQNRDATVKWNYVDLRFRPEVDVRIEAKLTKDAFIITFKSNGDLDRKLIISDLLTKPTPINDCYSCGNAACVKHVPKKILQPKAGKTTYILDNYWPEFDTYINENKKDNDSYIQATSKNTPLFGKNFRWNLDENKISSPFFAGFFRELKMRVNVKLGKNVFKENLAINKKFVASLAKHIPLDTTHIVVSQAFLPFLYDRSIFGGRTFDVLLTRFPIKELQERLNVTYKMYPQSKTLHNFRANKQVVELEEDALQHASTLITPHADIAKLFDDNIVKLPWILPSASTITTKGDKILFPSSLLARKGAYEIKKIVNDLGISIEVFGSATEDSTFDNSFKHNTFLGDYENVKLVVFPAYIEHEPRFLLKLIAMGIPIITTKATGVDASEFVTVIDSGDYDTLREEIAKQI